MKRSFVLLVVLFLFIAGCSKKDEVKLSVSGSNAFALDMGKEWEVQALTELHGFETVEQDDSYAARIFYSIDVITPGDQVLKSLFTKENNRKEAEEFKSLKLDAQFNIDGDYPVGKYKAVFNIKDMNSNKTLKDTVGFNLEK